MSSHAMTIDTASAHAVSAVETISRMAVYGLLLLGALVYNDYGVPEYWFSDEMTWVIAEMQSKGTLNPQFFIYPGGLQIYTSLFVYKLFVLLSSAGEGLDEVALIVITRTVSAGFFILTVYFAERATSTITGRVHDIKTVVLVGTSCALIHHAHIATVQSANFFGVALAYFAIARTIVLRSPRAYYWAAFSCGIPVSAKWNGIFVGAALPFVYIYAFRPNLFQLGKGMILTGLLSASAILLLNPFIILNFEKFKADLFVAAIKEAPFYRSAPPSLATTFEHAAFYMQAFFTDYGAILVAATVIAALAISLVYFVHRRANTSTPRFEVLERILFFSSLILVSSFVFLAIQTGLNIHQSRYYTQIGIAVALLFSLAVDTLLIAIVQWTRPRLLGAALLVVLLTLTVTAVLVLNVVNGIVHVAVFPLSAKQTSAGYVESRLLLNPDIKLLRLTSDGRGPLLVDPKLCSSRCYLIRLEDLPQKAALGNWDDFLAAVFYAVENIDADIVAVEGVLFHFSVFVPTGHDYSERLKHPNPGPEAWQNRFARLGYSEPLVFHRIAKLHPIQWLIGTGYHSTIEGIGGDVFLFEKRVQR
jgi:hypothetical protein